MSGHTRRSALAALASAGLAGCLDGLERADERSTNAPAESPTGPEPSTEPGTATATTTVPEERPTVDAVDGDWTHPRADAAGTRYDPAGSVPASKPRVTWEAAPGGDWGRLAVADGRLVVATRTVVAALDAATGEPLWRRSRDPGVARAGPVLSGDCYVGAGDELRALAPGDGTERWTATLAGPIERVVVGDDAAYVTTGGRDGRSGAVQAVAGGELAWTFRTDEVPVARFGSVAVVDGTVYAVGANSGSATWHHAVDAASGEQRWRAGGLNHSRALTVAGDAVLAAGFYGNVVAQAVDDGSTRWKRARPPAVRQLCAGPDRAYAASSADEPDALAGLALASGDVAWKRAGNGVAGAGDGLVAVDNGILRGLDRATGAVRWERRGGPDVRGLAVADSVVFVARGDGTVRALTA